MLHSAVLHYWPCVKIINKMKIYKDQDSRRKQASRLGIDLCQDLTKTGVDIRHNFSQ